MGVLEEGATIVIKRSDGRTQSALVSSIDFILNCAKVEWFEDGETKGKEIHFNAIASLNPDIIICEKSKIESTHYIDNNNYPRNDYHQEIKQQSHGHEQRAQSAKPRLTQNEYNDDDPLTSYDLAVQGKRLPVVSSSRSVIENISKVRESATMRKLSQLEKDRIERKQRNAQVKAVKKEIIKKCQDNPHWELMCMINEFRNTLILKPLSKNDRIEDHLITVAVRKRPLNNTDRMKKEIDIITIPSKNQLIVHEPKFKVDLTKYLENHVFKFDYTFNEDCTNEIVYKYTAYPLIKTVFEGGFATCFAYGQTGSGKTYTMSGGNGNVVDDMEKGIYALAATDIFKEIKSMRNTYLDLSVSCSFFEIYVKKVSDLLNGKKSLRILEDGKQQVQIVGLTEKIVNSVSDVLHLIEIGNDERASGQTSANVNSSRSHAIFQIYLRPKSNLKELHGKFSLIDLAGNERGADTFSSSKITRLEGSEINQSLLSLKECIRALGRKGAHLPFRGSKLTQVLRDSFVGVNSKTCMIAMVSPGVSSCENTLNTLRYADRVKELGGGDACQKSPKSPKSPGMASNGETSTSFFSARSINNFKKQRSFDDFILANLDQKITQRQRNTNENRCKVDEKTICLNREVIKKLKEGTEKAGKLLMSSKNDIKEYSTNWNFFIEDIVNFLLKTKL